MAVLRAKQKEVEAIEAMLAKMMEELKVRHNVVKSHISAAIAFLPVTLIFWVGGS